MGVEVCSLTKVYERGVRSLDEVTLSLGSGVLGLLGPNGAGKTTLMRILATLLDPTEGTATVEGFDVRRQRVEIRRVLGYLPQTFGLYPQMRCSEFLDYMGMLYGLSPKQRREAVDEALARVHLTELATTRVRTLSGGMKQRLGIAQAVLTRPRLLIVDEPTSGLDPEERIRIRNLLGELAQDRVVVLSTHIVQDVSSAATTLALIRQGKVIFHGSPSELLRRVKGQVWVGCVEESQLPQLKAACPVTNVSRTDQGLEARFITEDPSSAPGVSGAREAEPGLEDAYIWQMGDAVAQEMSV
ncbi:MAG TPA: ABC transporter ATP-binding protein [Armatimonadota bacterium]|jgi:ABC-type multidrug transport system ATPase subunit